MEIVKYIVFTVLGLGSLFILIFAAKSRRFFKTLFLNAILGVSAIAVIDLTSRFTGVYIPINYISALSGSVFGLPAVLGLLIANFIFI